MSKLVRGGSAAAVGDPAADGGSDVGDAGGRVVVVVPPECLQLLEDVGTREVGVELVDEVGVDVVVVGVAGHAMSEVVEDLGERVERQGGRCLHVQALSWGWWQSVTGVPFRLVAKG